MNSTLVVGTVPCLRGSLLAGVLAAAGLQPNDVDVATASSSEALASVASPSTYAAAFCIQEAPQPSAFLSALLRLLRPGGTCTLLEPGTQVRLLSLLGSTCAARRLCLNATTYALSTDCILHD